MQKNTEADLAQLLEGHSDKVRAIVMNLRAWMQDTFPILEEDVKLGWQNLTYSKNKVICAISPYKKHVGFHFYRGVELDDPDQMLQGTGKALRHLRITDPDKLPVEQLKKYTELAIVLDDGGETAGT